MSNYNKITALYSRLSVGDEDRDGGESNSIEQRHCVLPKFLKRQRVRYASSADIVRNC